MSSTKLSIIIASNYDPKGADDAKKSVTSLSDGVGKLGKIAAGAIVGAGTAIATFSVQSLQAFGSFQQGMNEVFTLLPNASQGAMDKMTGDMKAFMQETGRLSSEAIPALYQSISAGVPADNVFEFMRQANDMARGGVTTLETAVDGLSSVVNAYGADVIDVGRVSDLMFSAVKGGKTTIEELSRNLFNVTPIAAGLGLSFDNITAAAAAMTSQGIPTNVTMTSLRQLLVEVSKEGTKVSDTFKDVAGKSFKDFIADGGNLKEALDLLKQSAEDSGIGINDLFGSVEAGTAALALAGSGAKKFGDELAAAANSAGATDKAADTMAGSLTATFDRALTAVELLKVTLGEKLAPALVPALEMIVRKINDVVTLLDSKKSEGFFSNLATGAKWWSGEMGIQSQEMVQARLNEAKSLEDYLQVAKDVQAQQEELYKVEYHFGESASATDGRSKAQIDAMNRVRLELVKSTSSWTDYYAKIRELQSQGVDITNGMEFYDTFKDFEALRKTTVSFSPEVARLGGYVSGVAAQMYKAGQASDDLTASQEEQTAATERQGEVLKAAQDQLANFFDTNMKGIHDMQNVNLGTMLYDFGKQVGLNADDLQFYAIATGQVTKEEAEMARTMSEAQQRAAELAGEVKAGNITRADALVLLQEEYGARIDGINATIEHTKAMQEFRDAAGEVNGVVEGSAKAAAEATAIQRQAIRDLNKETGSLFTAQLQNNDAGKNSAQILFEQAQAAGAGIGALALLASATGDYTDAQIKSALASAAMMEKAKMLGQAIANGMSIDDAIKELDDFRTALNSENYTVTVQPDANITAVLDTYKEQINGVFAGIGEGMNVGDALAGLDEAAKGIADSFDFALGDKSGADRALSAMRTKVAELAEEISKGMPVEEAIAQLNAFRDTINQPYNVEVDGKSIDEAIDKTETLLGYPPPPPIKAKVDMLEVEGLLSTMEEIDTKASGASSTPYKPTVDATSVDTAVEKATAFGTAVTQMVQTPYRPVVESESIEQATDNAHELGKMATAVTDNPYKLEIDATTDAVMAALSLVKRTIEDIVGQTYQVNVDVNIPDVPGASTGGSGSSGGSSGGGGGGNHPSANASSMPNASGMMSNYAAATSQANISTRDSIPLYKQSSAAIMELFRHNVSMVDSMIALSVAQQMVNERGYDHTEVAMMEAGAINSLTAPYTDVTAALIENAAQEAAAAAAAGDHAEGADVAAIAQEAYAATVKSLNQELGGLFIRQLESNDALGNSADLLLEQAQNAGADLNALALLAARTGRYSMEQIQAALATAALTEKAKQLGEEIAGGMSIEEAIRQMDELRASLGLVEDTLGQTEEATAKLTAEMGNMFMKFLDGGPVTLNFADMLLQQAQAAGASMTTLALLAAQTDMYTEEQIKQALAMAALTERAKQLGEQIASGAIDVDSAISELSDFADSLGLNNASDNPGGGNGRPSTNATTSAMINTAQDTGKSAGQAAASAFSDAMANEAMPDVNVSMFLQTDIEDDIDRIERRLLAMTSRAYDIKLGIADGGPYSDTRGFSRARQAFSEEMEAVGGL